MCRVHRVQWHRINVHGQGVPHLRMTTNGRKLARFWTGVKAYKAPPFTDSVTASTRLAMNRSASGGMALSCSETMYHEGRFFQPAAVALSVTPPR